MVTTGYAVVLCGWLIYLAVQVIRQRRKHQVLFADGDVDALVQVRSTEYKPKMQLQKANVLFLAFRTRH
ncbi:hypothetical protein H8F11_22130 [Vibrio fluvialis]|uniref:hypothetical protein n=1 Tax=Vibrio fluvialis TaxID=676 RepID=UPI00192BDFCC|nr:hypothetical protein [Vibrio fluvialis]MBL4240707.1 hypothetical protein [Vibrio fluvialis]MBL4267398.1 hypothetical protein [Vibrio fluvialis]MBL4271803.1 hypothetical protein [Vibrio fluvialis]MBL4276163.1 hypothetical protein [Vibrio fluvialis]MBO1443061.1 hypothetical protein [Vibrio fluvialis]